MPTLEKTPVAAFIGVAILLTLVNIALVHRNARLQQRLASVKKQFEPYVGMFVPPLSGFDANGQFLTIAPSAQRKTVLLIFSVECPFSQENWPLWRSLLKQLDRAHYQPVGINLGHEFDRDLLRQVGLEDIPLIVSVSPESVLSYRLRFVPQTIVVGTDGRVENVWSGPLRGKVVKEVEQVLEVKLPDTHGR